MNGSFRSKSAGLTTLTAGWPSPMNPGSGAAVVSTRSTSRFAMRDIYSAMPTHVDELERLFGYHYWATHKLLKVVATLTDEEYARDVAGTYGSVRNTLVHTLSAEWGWLD